MLIRNMLLKYYAPENGGSGNGGGGNNVEITPEIQQLIDERIAQETAGLKNKNHELLGTIREQKDSLARFDGIDPDAVKTILQRFSDDEEAKLIAEGKIDQVLEKRTERFRADSDKQIKAAVERAEKAEGFANKFRDRVLADAIREAGLKAGVLPTASDDLILRARGTFKVNDEGEAVAVDSDGNAILGKDGKTPLSPIEWAESLKDTAPHLFPAAEGTGGGGHKQGGGGGSLKRSEMTSQEKTDYIRKHGQQAFLKLPK